MSGRHRASCRSSSACAAAEVNTGRWEDEYGTKLFLNLERRGMRWASQSRSATSSSEEQQFPVLTDRRNIACGWAAWAPTIRRARDRADAFAERDAAPGHSFGVLTREKCTGDPARRLGNDLVFAAAGGSRTCRRCARRKVEKLVSICPHCVRTIAEDWKEFGADVAIEHHSEFMARHKHQLPAADSGKRVVVPRSVLSRAVIATFTTSRAMSVRNTAAVVDPPRARERSFCCGAGGGLVFLGEETGQRVNQTRAKELAATGADVIGAACPFCNTMFRDALAAGPPNAPALLDIAQIVAASLPVKSPDEPGTLN